MARKVYVDLTVRVVMLMEEDVDLDTVIAECAVDLPTEGVTVEDAEVQTYTVVDSK